MHNLRFLFMRHGETTANIANICSGGDNIHELTEQGIKEVANKVENFSKLDIMPDKVYFSPAVRTVQTKDIFMSGDKFKFLPTHEIAEFKERCFGEFENEDFNLIKSQVWNSDFYPEGGEQVKIFINRVESALKILADDNSCSLPIVISHGMVFEAIFRIFGQDAPWIYNGDIYEINITLCGIKSTKLA